ncbi:hypothetical protein [Streptomyces mangrovisoli]|uniref:hypothetical protein n=1 Tax=Streptomyces mangrovisoli TaxID=1428628 RepID=UPI000AFBF2BD|nr:hypothetical protein [Streptomyces mangrovisoli]
MVRRPVAWIVAVVLLVEAFTVGAVNWFLGTIVDRQNMSMAGLDPDRMALGAKAGGLVFGLYLALCGVVALLVAIRDRAPAGVGRVLLISVAVVHALLGAFAWGLIGWRSFLYMVIVLALIVLLLMTYDAQAEPETAPGTGEAPAAPAGDERPEEGAPRAEEDASGAPEAPEGEEPRVELTKGPAPKDTTPSEAYADALATAVTP